jgi:hypothetical protein
VFRAVSGNIFTRAASFPAIPLGNPQNRRTAFPGRRDVDCRLSLRGSNAAFAERRATLKADSKGRPHT